MLGVTLKIFVSALGVAMEWSPVANSSKTKHAGTVLSAEATVSRTVMIHELVMHTYSHFEQERPIYQEVRPDNSFGFLACTD
jgi:hypothetical protein